MKKIANVIFPYSAKNNDELDLIVGDKIEVIGLEEEGWWRGKLKGKIGVFPINFVQIIETDSISDNNKNISTSATSKLASIFGNKANKNSSSRNSLNSNNSSNSLNNNQNMENNNQGNSNTNFTSVNDDDDSPPIAFSEIKPKPIKGVGYGDIFAIGGGVTKLKPLPADPTTTPTIITATNLTGSSSVGNIAKERLNITSSISSNITLNKPIPKKPPPPAPITDSNQAPALPPKPINQFSPLLQQQQQIFRSLAQQQQKPTAQQVREQAKVIYAYEPVNEDELAMEVGDIIDIIDKEIEDAGWWRGELRGKIGVFPDNFVQIIEAKENLPPPPPINIENKINTKPIQSDNTIEKELENDLSEKQLKHNNNNNNNNTASIKRNKFQHLTKSLDSSLMNPTVNENGRDVNQNSLTPLSNTTSPLATKLNHITVNRAKGPSRKPPTTNVFKIKDQSNQFRSNLESSSSSDINIDKINSDVQIEKNNKFIERPKSLINHNTLSLKVSKKSEDDEEDSTITQNLSAQSDEMKQTTNKTIDRSSIKSSSSMDNVLENQSISQNKTNQTRPFQQSTLPTIEKTKISPTTPSTPSWMKDLLKKKRDSPAVVATPLSIIDKINSTSPIINPTQHQVFKAEQVEEKDKQGQEKRYNIEEVESTNFSSSNIVFTKEQCEKLIELVTKNVIDELNELKEDIKILKTQNASLSCLKNNIDEMKLELKDCQSAIDNQKKYMKDLVNNLADERKKISLMQEELDRNFK